MQLYSYEYFGCDSQYTTSEIRYMGEVRVRKPVGKDKESNKKETLPYPAAGVLLPPIEKVRSTGGWESK